MRFCRSRWRVFSPTRSMAATATWRGGRWSAIRACRRPIGKTSSNISTRNTTNRRARSRTFLEQERVMAIILKDVDAVCIGVGFTGSILARELTKSGLKVVGLERGANRSSREDFALPNIRDDLRYAVRQELFQDTQLETVSLRHSPGDTALPIRRLGSFLPGTGLGGAGAHWNGVTWRLLPSDHNLRTHLQNRYGGNAIPAELTIEDYPVSYDELEPYYDKFEKLCGISGKAGNLRGQKIDGGNVFEGPRQYEYPNKPLMQPMAGAIMDAACRSLGFHPFPAPAANSSDVYTN